ncbi:MAG: GMC family oxidoreductase, partial [Chitinophagaceae bacterium]
IGANLKETLSEPGPWVLGMTAFGETLPYHENKISLDKNTKDKWGLPVIAFDAEIKDNEKKMRIDMLQDGKDMLAAMGATEINGVDGEYALGMGIHEMGTARMGTSPKNSVLNKHNQVWDCTNVFVTDGACMTSAACQNPSLTYMALTARAAEYAVQELKKGNI